MKYLRPVQLYNELLKLNTTGPLLGFSVGNRHVGLAISDASKRDSYPFRTLVKNQTDFDSVASDLQSLISKHSIAGFVIGVPHSSSDGGPTKLFLEDLLDNEKFEDMNFTVWVDKCSTKRMFQAQRKVVQPKFASRPLSCTRLMDYYAALRFLRITCGLSTNATKKKLEKKWNNILIGRRHGYLDFVNQPDKER